MSEHQRAYRWARVSRIEVEIDDDGEGLEVSVWVTTEAPPGRHLMHREVLPVSPTGMVDPTTIDIDPTTLRGAQ